MSRYYLGSPCALGHTLRYRRNGGCADCNRAASEVRNKSLAAFKAKMRAAESAQYRATLETLAASLDAAGKLAAQLRRDSKRGAALTQSLRAYGITTALFRELAAFYTRSNESAHKWLDTQTEL